MASPTGITYEQLMQILATNNKQMSETFMEAVKEIRKPTEREQRQLDAENEKLARNQKARLEVARAEEQRKLNMKRTCPHSTVHPGTGIRKHQWRAQVSTPANEKPFFIPICTQCFSQGPKILATPEMLQNGVNLDQYADLDLERLEQWAKATQTTAA